MHKKFKYADDLEEFDNEILFFILDFPERFSCIMTLLEATPSKDYLYCEAHIK